MHRNDQEECKSTVPSTALRDLDRSRLSINEQGSLLSFACPHPSVHPSMPPPGPDGRIEICPKLQSGILAHSIPPFVAGFVSCSSCSALLWPGIFYGPSVLFVVVSCIVQFLIFPLLALLLYSRQICPA